MGLLENRFDDNVVVEKLDKLLSWARSTSPWFFQFGTACCAIEMMAAAASRHDLMRIGIIPRWAFEMDTLLQLKPAMQNLSKNGNGNLKKQKIIIPPAIRRQVV